MNDFILSCCSTADLSLEYFKKRNIPIVYFHFSIDDENFLDDCGQTISPDELFKRIDKGSITKTSQVTIEEYKNFFEPYLKINKDIIHISLSSGLSGSVNSARIAADELKLNYPNRKIYIVDSLAASSGYGLLVDTLADMRDNGLDIDTLYQFAENNKLKIHHWFFSTDLTYFIRGGRVSKTAGFVGQLLNIIPLLNVNNKGMLIPREKIRGIKQVIHATLEKMKKYADDNLAYSKKCFISHSLSIDNAKELAQLIEQTFKNLDGKVQIFNIGTTIGSHTGPGTIALFFYGDERIE